VTPTATEKGACPLCGIDYPHVEVACGPDFEYRTTGEQEFRLTRCTRCQTIVLNPRPVDAAIAGLYPPEYEPYRFDCLNPIVKAGRDLVQRGKTRFILGCVPSGGTIVDVGCGGGALLKLLRGQTGERFQLIGWDYPGPHLDALSAEGIATIAEPLDSAMPPVDVDLFVLNQVIEHVPHPDRLIGRLAAALKTGGHILIETPNTRALDARWFGRRYWGGYHIPRHMVLFDEENLRRLVEKVGLRVVECAHLASPAFWVQSLHHWLSETRVSPLAKACVIRNAPLVAMFAAFDTMRVGLGGGTSNQRLVAQRALP
jgi:2-polyprenyl-3-methyl-5-hydroxy-6-metoxy-1,4-benzoquinol methylase